MKLIKSVAIATLAVTALACDRGNQSTEQGSGYTSQSEILNMTNDERTSPGVNEGEGSEADLNTGALSGTADSDTTDVGAGAAVPEDSSEQSTDSGTGAEASPDSEPLRNQDSDSLRQGNEATNQGSGSSQDGTGAGAIDNTSSENDQIDFHGYEGSGPSSQGSGSSNYDNTSSETDDVNFQDYEGINSDSQ